MLIGPFHQLLNINREEGRYSWSSHVEAFHRALQFQKNWHRRLLVLARYQSIMMIFILYTPTRKFTHAIPHAIPCHATLYHTTPCHTKSYHTIAMTYTYTPKQNNQHHLASFHPISFRPTYLTHPIPFNFTISHPIPFHPIPSNAILYPILSHPNPISRHPI